MQRQRDYWLNWNEQQTIAPPDTETLFSSLEGRVLAAFREYDFASGFVSRYQRMRLNQHLHYDIACILMYEKVLSKHAQQQPIKQLTSQDWVTVRYQDKLRKLRQKLADVEQAYPQFYEKFLIRLFGRSTIKSALKTVDNLQHCGEIGIKPGSHIKRLLQQTLSSLPAKVQVDREIRVSELIQLTPLFSELSEYALQQLAKHAKQVIFLKGDIIISESDKGDAMYIILQGRVQVSRSRASGSQQHLADLDNGEFFGEMALLGNHCRTATVSALETSTLLRLSEQDVRHLMQKDHEIAEQLQITFKKRLHSLNSE